MDFIKKKWFLIVFIYAVIAYLIFIVGMKNWFFLFLALALIFIVSIILFMGNFIGTIGILIQIITKSPNRSMKLYETAYNLGTTNTQVMSAYGLQLLRTFHVDEAKEVFENALKSSTYYLNSKTLRANICICLWKQGHIEKAYQDYLALLYYPDKEEISNFSLDNLNEGKEKNSAFTYQDFITLGFLALLNEKYQEAEYFSRVALLIKKDFASAYDNLGQIYYFQNKFVEAKENFLKALKLNENLPDSLFYMAKIYIKENQIDLAKSRLEKALLQDISALNTVSKKEIQTLLSSLN